MLAIASDQHPMPVHCDFLVVPHFQGWLDWLFIFPFLLGWWCWAWAGAWAGGGRLFTAAPAPVCWVGAHGAGGCLFGLPLLGPFCQGLFLLGVCLFCQELVLVGGLVLLGLFLTDGLFAFCQGLFLLVVSCPFWQGLFLLCVPFPFCQGLFIFFAPFAFGQGLVISVFGCAFCQGLALCALGLFSLLLCSWWPKFLFGSCCLLARLLWHWLAVSSLLFLFFFFIFSLFLFLLSNGFLFFCHLLCLECHCILIPFSSKPISLSGCCPDPIPPPLCGGTTASRSASFVVPFHISPFVVHGFCQARLQPGFCQATAWGAGGLLSSPGPGLLASLSSFQILLIWKQLWFEPKAMHQQHATTMGNQKPCTNNMQKPWGPKIPKWCCVIIPETWGV